MEHLHTTICALATPPGEGGIATVRVSGPDAYGIVGKIFAPVRQGKSVADAKGYTAMLGHYLLHGAEMDECVALFFRAPHSYTGEDVIELSVHGGTAMADGLLEALITAGCAPAGPGEFTRRALENGRMSLTQAEAVMEVIAANGRQGAALAKSALDGRLAKRIGKIQTALQTLNELREQAVVPLRTLRLALTKAQTVDEQVRAVAALLETLDVAGRLQAQQEALEQAGQVQRAQECGQLYEALISALEQMDQVLGTASLETELFVQLFTMLLQNTTVGSIPSVCDAVQLTTLPMLRHRCSRVLLVLGANDGLLPAFSDPGGLLADPERQKLRSLGVELSPGRNASADREMSWVCAALSAAEQRVCLVTDSAQPSFLYTRTSALFPALQPVPAEDFSFLPDCAAAAGAALQQITLPDWLPEAELVRLVPLRLLRGRGVAPDTLAALHIFLHRHAAGSGTRALRQDHPALRLEDRPFCRLPLCVLPAIRPARRAMEAGRIRRTPVRLVRA